VVEPSAEEMWGRPFEMEVRDGVLVCTDPTHPEAILLFEADPMVVDDVLRRRERRVQLLTRRQRGDHIP
jgi:hypothetical protein